MLNMYTRIIPAGPGVTNVSPHPTLHTGAEHESEITNLLRNCQAQGPAPDHTLNTRWSGSVQIQSQAEKVNESNLL